VAFPISADVREWIIRLWGTLTGSRRDKELAEELRLHLDLAAADEAKRSALPLRAAQRTAALRLGGMTQSLEAVRDQRGLPGIESLWRDVRYAIRTLRRSPGFAAVAILTLALGIGGNTAVFSVVDAVLLKPLPYPQPDRLVTLFSIVRGQDNGPFTGQINNADFYDWQTQTTSFDAMAYFVARQTPFIVGERAEYALIGRVSGDFFKVFGAKPIAGRLLGEGDVGSGPPTVAVVNSSFARNHFGGDAEAIGRRLTVANRPLQIVGVVDAGFNFPEGTEIWGSQPLPDFTNPRTRFAMNYGAVARLKAGRRLEHAQAEMTTIASRLEHAYPDTNAGRKIVVGRLLDQMVGNVRLMLYVLLAAVGLVLLIACSNLATLFLARATARAHEINVRRALGANRARIVRQMLVEGLVFGSFSGALGLGLAFAGKAALVASVPSSVPRLGSIAIDLRALGFTMVVSIIASLLLALAPAVQVSHMKFETGLRPRSDTGPDARRLREGLVVLQLALAVVLLIAGGLLMRSFVALQRVPLGFQPERVLVVDATVANSDPRRGDTLYYRDLLAAVTGLPGVRAAGATMVAPGRIDASGGYWIDHIPERNELNDGASTVFSVVSPGTFQALGIPLVQGRDFDDRDVHGAPLTAMVNDALARQTPHGRDVVGHKIVCGFDSLEPMTIVGVVADIHQAGPADQPRPECYMPYLQHQFNNSKLSLVIRTSGDPLSLANTVRGKARELAPTVPLRFTTLDALAAQNVAQPRFRAFLVAAFAAVALLLAVIGVFGVMAYTVRQRTPEIGLRVALGATSRHIRRLFFARGSALIGIGLLAGLSVSIVATRYLGTLLFTIQPTDRATYVAVAVLLTVVSLLALYIPIRRATTLNPLTALRYE
jgi:putative ABC transport system permease protein